MPRFYFQYCELEDDSWEYVVFDRLRGSDNHIALCVRDTDAEKICAALNGMACVHAEAYQEQPAPGVFG